MEAFRFGTSLRRLRDSNQVKQLSFEIASDATILKGLQVGNHFSIRKMIGLIYTGISQVGERIVAGCSNLVNRDTWLL